MNSDTSSQSLSRLRDRLYQLYTSGSIGESEYHDLLNDVVTAEASLYPDSQVLNSSARSSLRTFDETDAMCARSDVVVVRGMPATKPFEDGMSFFHNDEELLAQSSEIALGRDDDASECDVRTIPSTRAVRLQCALRCSDAMHDDFMDDSSTTSCEACRSRLQTRFQSYSRDRSIDAGLNTGRDSISSEEESVYNSTTSISHGEIGISFPSNLHTPDGSISGFSFTDDRSRCSGDSIDPYQDASVRGFIPSRPLMQTTHYTSQGDFDANTDPTTSPRGSESHLIPNAYTSVEQRSRRCTVRPQLTSRTAKSHASPSYSTDALPEESAVYSDNEQSQTNGTEYSTQQICTDDLRERMALLQSDMASNLDSHLASDAISDGLFDNDSTCPSPTLGFGQRFRDPLSPGGHLTPASTQQRSRAADHPSDTESLDGGESDALSHRALASVRAPDENHLSDVNTDGDLEVNRVRRRRSRDRSRERQSMERRSRMEETPLMDDDVEMFLPSSDELHIDRGAADVDGSFSISAVEEAQTLYVLLEDQGAADLRVDETFDVRRMSLYDYERRSMYPGLRRGTYASLQLPPDTWPVHTSNGNNHVSQRHSWNYRGLIYQDSSGDPGRMDDRASLYSGLNPEESSSVTSMTQSIGDPTNQDSQSPHLGSRNSYPEPVVSSSASPVSFHETSVLDTFVSDKPDGLVDSSDALSAVDDGQIQSNSVSRANTLSTSMSNMSEDALSTRVAIAEDQASRRQFPTERCPYSEAHSSRDFHSSVRDRATDDPNSNNETTVPSGASNSRGNFPSTYRPFVPSSLAPVPRSSESSPAFEDGFNTPLFFYSDSSSYDGYLPSVLANYISTLDSPSSTRSHSATSTPHSELDGERMHRTSVRSRVSDGIEMGIRTDIPSSVSTGPEMDSGSGQLPPLHPSYSSGASSGSEDGPRDDISVANTVSTGRVSFSSSNTKVYFYDPSQATTGRYSSPSLNKRKQKYHSKGRRKKASDIQRNDISSSGVHNRHVSPLTRQTNVQGSVDVEFSSNSNLNGSENRRLHPFMTHRATRVHSGASSPTEREDGTFVDVHVNGKSPDTTYEGSPCLDAESTVRAQSQTLPSNTLTSIQSGTPEALTPGSGRLSPIQEDSFLSTKAQSEIAACEVSRQQQELIEIMIANRKRRLRNAAQRLLQQVRSSELALEDADMNGIVNSKEDLDAQVTAVNSVQEKNKKVPVESLTIAHVGPIEETNVQAQEAVQKTGPASIPSTEPVTARTDEHVASNSPPRRSDLHSSESGRSAISRARQRAIAMQSAIQSLWDPTIDLVSRKATNDSQMNVDSSINYESKLVKCEMESIGPINIENETWDVKPDIVDVRRADVVHFSDPNRDETSSAIVKATPASRQFHYSDADDSTVWDEPHTLPSSATVPLPISPSRLLRPTTARIRKPIPPCNTVQPTLHAQPPPIPTTKGSFPPSGSFLNDSSLLTIPSKSEANSCASTTSTESSLLHEHDHIPNEINAHQPYLTSGLEKLLVKPRSAGNPMVPLQILTADIPKPMLYRSLPHNSSGNEGSPSRSHRKERSHVRQRVLSPNHGADVTSSRSEFSNNSEHSTDAEFPFSTPLDNTSGIDPESDEVNSSRQESVYCPGQPRDVHSADNASRRHGVSQHIDENQGIFDTPSGIRGSRGALSVFGTRLSPDHLFDLTTSSHIEIDDSSALHLGLKVRPLRPHSATPTIKRYSSQ